MSDPNEDPISLFVVIRESLNMTPGKMSIQVGNAVEKVVFKFFKMQIFYVKHLLSEKDENCCKMTTAWMQNGSNKVLVSANETDWNNLKQEYPEHFLVKDAASEAVMTFWPNRNSNQKKILESLMRIE